MIDKSFERNGYVDALGLSAPDGLSAYEAGLKALAAGPQGSTSTRRRSNASGRSLPDALRGVRAS